MAGRALALARATSTRPDCHEDVSSCVMIRHPHAPSGLLSRAARAAAASAPATAWRSVRSRSLEDAAGVSCVPC